MKQVKGGVTAAKGFEAASTAAGIKYKDRTDMALVYSQVPCVAAGTFTTNVVKAAPVKWDQQVVKSGAKAQAVVVNSGIANACTGAEGFGYCKDTADAAAKALNISADGVLIGSTGVIGKQIPIDKLTAGIEALAGKKNDTLENGTEAAKAIMTTDTRSKQVAVTVDIKGKIEQIKWKKESEYAPINLYDENGAELKLNIGETDCRFVLLLNVQSVPGKTKSHCF